MAARTARRGSGPRPGPAVRRRGRRGSSGRRLPARGLRQAGGATAPGADVRRSRPPWNWPTGRRRGCSRGTSRATTVLVAGSLDDVGDSTAALAGTLARRRAADRRRPRRRRLVGGRAGRCARSRTSGPGSSTISGTGSTAGCRSRPTPRRDRPARAHHERHARPAAGGRPSSSAGSSPTPRTSCAARWPGCARSWRSTRAHPESADPAATAAERAGRDRRRCSGWSTTCSCWPAATPGRSAAAAGAGGPRRRRAAAGRARRAAGGRASTPAASGRSRCPGRGQLSGLVGNLARQRRPACPRAGSSSTLAGARRRRRPCSTSPTTGPGSRRPTATGCSSASPGSTTRARPGRRRRAGPGHRPRHRRAARGHACTLDGDRPAGARFVLRLPVARAGVTG